MGAEMYCGDCMDILPTLEAGSVQCCITSPPYWGLRDYGTASWEGGSVECNHIEKKIGSGTRGGLAVIHFNNGDCPNVEKRSDTKLFDVTYRGQCGKCGALRIDSQLGFESTPESISPKWFPCSARSGAYCAMTARFG